MTEPAYDRPFAGIRVVDMSQGVAGPGCGYLLAAHGAEVVKIEPPAGDWLRGLDPRHGDHSAMSLAVNRGKRGVALDLKHPRGRAAALRLLDRADVAIQSARPGGMARLGLDYDSVRARNERLLYVSVSSYGSRGPYADRAGTDTVLQAWSGLMAVNRDADGRPRRVGFVLVDCATAMYAFQTAAAALFARRGGAGRHIEVDLMQGAAALLAPKLAEAHLQGGAMRSPNAPAGAYRARDGWIAVTLVRESHFAGLCRVLGRPELAVDPRFDTGEKRAEREAELREIVAAVLSWPGARAPNGWRRSARRGCCPTRSTTRPTGSPTRTSSPPTRRRCWSRRAWARSRSRASRACRTPRTPTSPPARRAAARIRNGPDQNSVKSCAPTYAIVIQSFFPRIRGRMAEMRRIDQNLVESAAADPPRAAQDRGASRGPAPPERPRSNPGQILCAALSDCNTTIFSTHPRPDGRNAAQRSNPGRMRGPPLHAQAGMYPALGRAGSATRISPLSSARRMTPEIWAALRASTPNRSRKLAFFIHRLSTWLRTA